MIDVRMVDLDMTGQTTRESDPGPGTAPAHPPSTAAAVREHSRDSCFAWKPDPPVFEPSGFAAASALWPTFESLLCVTLSVGSADRLVLGGVGGASGASRLPHGAGAGIRMAHHSFESEIPQATSPRCPAA